MIFELLVGALALYLLLVVARSVFGVDNKLWKSEDTIFVDPSSHVQHDFPSLLTDGPTVKLSVIVPAYNEEKRIGRMLDETLSFLKRKQSFEQKSGEKFSYEIIVVDDGSSDQTSQVVNKYIREETTELIRLLKLSKNRGKGGAIRRGMMVARGEQLLMADADGATQFSCLDDLMAGLEKMCRKSSVAETHGIAIGSRSHLVDTEQVVNRKWYRNILMHGFHFIVWLLCVKNIKDTQCGFKLFTRKTARFLFPNQHVERWAFDVELLFLAESHGIPMVEVGVTWEEIDGSKLSPLWSSLEMARDILRVRFFYLLGLWNVDIPYSV